MSGLRVVRAVLAASLLAGLLCTAPVPLGRHAVAIPDNAPDPASALALAKQRGARVEVVNERTETRTVYAEPSGAMTAAISMLPTRVRRGAGWVAPDTTVVRRPDGSVGPAAAPVDIAFSGGGNGPMVRLARADQWLEISWPGQLPAPRLVGSKATYAEVLPGVDLVLTASLSGYAQHLIVKNAAAARQLTEVRLGLRTGGVVLRSTPVGGLTATDDKGKVVFAAGQSRMWDAAGRQAVVDVAVGNGALLLRPDRALLHDPAARFPITIDPVIDAAGFAAWTSVLSGNANTAYPNTSGEHPLAQVGFCYTGWSDCNDIHLAWSYFQFNTDWLAHGPTHRRVLSARLNLTVAHSADCSGTATPHRLYEAHNPIHPGTTWNNRPGGTHLTDFNPPKANPNYGCGGYKEMGIPVTDSVNRGGTTTYLVTAADEGNSATGKLHWRKYDAFATKLLVTWNDRPFLPYELTTDPPIPAPCKNCGGMRFFGDENITLKARLSDPNEHDDLSPVWRIFTDGVMDHRPPVDYKVRGEAHSAVVQLRHGTGVEWYVKAFDRADHSWNPNHDDGWTHGDGSSPFVVDRAAPNVAPGVDSPTYDDDGRWHGGAGIPGAFVFDSGGVSDIDHFVYSFDGAPVHKVDADRLGGKAVVQLTPTKDGPRGLTVWSVDRAGHRSVNSKTYHFYVRPGRGAVAQWSLEGSTKDDAYLGDRHGTLNGNAKFAPGAVGSGLRLDGLQPGTNMSAPSPLRTDASFSVSAWVKPEPARAGQVMGAVSQDGDRNSGFYLAYRGDMNKWAFLMPHNNDELNPSATYAAAPEPPQIGRWTHLTGVYDRPANKVRLYVNGVKRAEESLPAGFVPWDAAHTVYVGRQQCAGSKCDPWSGGIDEVRLHDRVLPETEIQDIVSQDNVQVGEWKFDELSGDHAESAVENGRVLTLQNGAALTGDSDEDGKPDGGAVGGAVQLDGVDDSATTGAPVVQTDQSFSVAAWARLDRAPPVGQTFPVLAQDGSQISGFFVWYRQLASGGAWEFFLPSANATSRPADDMVVFRVPSTPAPGKWTHLAAVYNGANRTIQLYVDGVAAGNPLPRNFGFDATGSLMVGRGLWNGNPTTAWPGGVDEVRAYSRALSTAEVQSLVSKDNVTAGEWRLDGNANGKTAVQNGTVHGAVSWVAGKTAMPDPRDQAAQFGATGAHISAPNAVDLRSSFSVSAWIRPDRFGSWWVPLSQDGNVVSGFKIQLTDEGHWTFIMFGADETNGGSTSAARAIGPLAQPGVWQHVTGGYDAAAGKLLLYVNGVLADTTSHRQTWNYPTGRLVIGADKWNGARGGSFPGSVDDMVLHQRVLFADEIRALAGRDLSLAHNWALDEASGTAVADSVGRRTGSFVAGSGWTPGRVGNGVTLDGIDDHVAVPGVDIRTDENFTVSGWVWLDQTCDRGTAFACSLAAVSLDGSTAATTDSKFRLGHLKDANHPEGVWMFEMPEPDGTRRAAVTIRPSDLRAWVHLAGVYNRATGKLVLYVNGTRKGEALLQNPWHGTGQLLIGRGRVAGQPGQFFRGQVDDVRLYSGRLDDERLSDLYNSYPKP